ncbi:MAG: HD domain-containing protein [Bacteriovoracaceae bacterium]|nr:HD domain-containing protein [Bacteriovoracaceae bacterium]
MIKSFFTIDLKLIMTGVPIPYDLFVNSSASTNEKFVRIFPTGDILTKSDLFKLKGKYQQLYIPEDQRSAFMKSITKSDSFEDVEKAKVIKDAAIQHLETLFSPDKDFSTEVLNDAIDGCKESVESMVDVLEDYSVDKLQNLIGELSFHDFYTYDHSMNVGMYSMSLYKSYKPDATRKELVQAGMGGLLHDLGKIKIPTDIINNPGQLTDDQFDQIKKHPKYGFDLLHDEGTCCDGEINVEVLGRVIFEHHENFNGTGYPSKLQGDEIHLLARITAIADFFDAITTKRSYHEVVSTEEALSIMANAKGKKVDPTLFDIFVKHVHGLKDRGDLPNVSLPEDFDPCQPHKSLPLSESKDFGRIKLLEENKKKKKSTKKKKSA